MKEIKAIRKALDRAGFKDIGVEKWRQSVRLTGEVATWEEYLQAGYLAVGRGFREVVNHIQVSGVEFEGGSIPQPPFQDSSLEGVHFDVVVVGGGVVGAAVARELTRWEVRVAVLEKEEDLARHASGRNNGMIHPAFAPSPGTRKAHYNALGNRMFPQLSRELGLQVEWPGTLALFPQKWFRLAVPLMYRRAWQNGVKGARYLSPEKLQAWEPHLNPQYYGAFFMPEGGIVNPFQLTIAYGENAVDNGAFIYLQTAVREMGVENDGGRRKVTRLHTNRGRITASAVVNAAGVWADVIAGMADDAYFSIKPRHGAVAILDKKASSQLQHNVGVLALKEGTTKGGGVTPTTAGNVLIGPTAEETPYREDYATYTGDMEQILHLHLPLIKTLRRDQVITYFAGTRASTFSEDFIIEISPRVSNLIHVAGIQSPGLSSVPAIAQEASSLAVEAVQRENGVELRQRESFDPCRRPTPDLKLLSLEERSRLIQENPDYGRIVCRCEGVSRGEVVDSLHTPLEVNTLDGVKRRVRAGMGRCQGGFCTPRLLDILSREQDVPVEEIGKAGFGSELVKRRTKEGDGCREAKEASTESWS